MDEFASYEHFLVALRDRLNAGLPGRDAQMEMAPATRKAMHDIEMPGLECSEAAVLALFYPGPDQPARPRLLLTVRPDDMKKHAGQVAFPGGRREEEESLEETALRETEEEVHIPAHEIEILGPMTSLYIPPSRFCVYPYVGAMHRLPDLTATSDEVASLFGVTIADLIDPTSRRFTEMELRGQRQPIPYFDLNGEVVWGATAMMLAELSSILADVTNAAFSG